MTRYYHGSDTEILKPDLSKCKKGKDFGKGFYLTEDRQKAFRMAKRTARINGTEPYVNEFEGPSFRHDSPLDLKVKVFEAYDAEWAEFIYCNREIPDYTHDYDVVIGPTADDDIRRQFLRFSREEIDFSILCKELKYEEADHQICLCSDKALKYITKI